MEAHAHRSGPAWSALAVAVYALVAGVVLASDRWDPLADWAVAVVTVASLALGLLIGRWWAVAFASLIVLLAPLGPRDYPLALFFLAVIGVPAEALVVAAGVGARKLLDLRRAIAGQALGALVMAAALVAVAYGVYLDIRVADRSPGNPVLLDERTGSYRGIRPGAGVDRVRALVGEGKPGDDDKVPSPLGVDPTDVSGPPALSGDWTTLRYSDLAVLVDDAGKVIGFVTTDDDAQTRAGVAVGDSLEIAERRYAGLTCEVADLGHDEPYPAYPECFARLATGATLSFGGDPIDSLWVLADPALGARALPLRER